MRKQAALKIFPFKIIVLFIFLLPQISEAIEPISRSFTPKDQTSRDIIRGIEILYDWEFDEAEKLFSKVIAERPEDPIGYFYLAMATWSRLASGFWSPEVVAEYEYRIDRATSVARKSIANGKADNFTYFYLGGALGFKGRLQLMEQKWLSSFFLALDAIDALKTCLKMDPNNRDVLFGLGIYDYYTARLSGVLKFLSYLLIHKGDKEEGLRKLHIAANEAIYSSIEAKSLLLHIYLFMEPLQHKARPLADELAERFKKNARFKFLQGVVYIRLGMDSKYREVTDFLNKRSREETSSKTASIWSNRALYLEASNDLFHFYHHQARLKLDMILSQADPILDPAMAIWPLLKKGMSYDLEGERQKALEYYRHILKLKNGGGAQFLAEKYIKKPPKINDPFLCY